VPRTTSVDDWPRHSEFTDPFGRKRPLRGPQKKAEMRAVVPPSMCTAEQPAKSIMPMPRRGSSWMIERKPVSDHNLKKVAAGQRSEGWWL
jgi:hypothetical protein